MVVEVVREHPRPAPPAVVSMGWPLTSMLTVVTRRIQTEGKRVDTRTMRRSLDHEVPTPKEAVRPLGAREDSAQSMQKTIRKRA
jgi:hypothetical protein